VDTPQGTGTEPGGTTTPPAGGTGTGSTGDDWTDRDAWRGLAKELGLSPAEVKKRLEHSRTWEKRAKENSAGAQKAQTLEEQISEMRKALAERDALDVQRAERTATTELRAALAEAGLDKAEIGEALELVDPSKLLADNEPDDKAIAAMAKRLSRLAGRAQPDRDQGQGTGGGNGGGFSMNNWVRGQVAAKRGR
jgi:DNA-binding transcriptional MerR regulator